MAIGRDDDQLITRLLNETYDVLPSQNVTKNSKDLSEYFNQKASVTEFSSVVKEIEKFSSKSQVFASDLDFNSKTLCFHMKWGSDHVDFPSNWSCFEKLYKSKSNGFLSFRDEVLGGFFLVDAQQPVIFLIKAGKKNYIVAVDESREFEFKWVSEKISSLQAIEDTSIHSKDLLPKAA